MTSECCCSYCLKLGMCLKSKGKWKDRCIFPLSREMHSHQGGWMEGSRDVYSVSSAYVSWGFVTKEGNKVAWMWIIELTLFPAVSGVNTHLCVGSRQNKQAFPRREDEIRERGGERTRVQSQLDCSWGIYQDVCLNSFFAPLDKQSN